MATTSRKVKKQVKGYRVGSGQDNQSNILHCNIFTFTKYLHFTNIRGKWQEGITGWLGIKCKKAIKEDDTEKAEFGS